jgi:methionine-rich copper-binding protein CopC
MTIAAAGFGRALLFAGVMLASPLVFAHAHLKAQTPAENTQVATSPEAITLTFTEGIEPKFSGLTVTDAKKQTVKTDTATRSETDRTKMIVPLLQTLQSGDYTVDWHVVSVDGHKTHGSYTFSVK